MNLIDILKADYQRFPEDQTYSIYAPNVYFKDPLNEFSGLERYQTMVNFIRSWFLDIQLDLHEIFQQAEVIHTQWTLSWTVPLPWRPRVSIPGRSELQFNAEDLIISHIDYWNCSRLDVVKQLFGGKPS
ncbi:MAG: DUF2358 domain-containing protein [Microcoleaceae cyanobacterium]